MKLVDFSFNRLFLYSRRESVGQTNFWQGVNLVKIIETFYALPSIIQKILLKIECTISVPFI